MKRINLKWLLFTLILSVGIHFLVLMNVPRLIMLIVMNRMAKQSVTNGIYNAPIPMAGADPIVRMSPDILYSSSVYDVSEQPVRYRFQVPANGSYWSISLYDARNTANVFALNDQSASFDEPTSEVVFVVKSKDSDYQPMPNERVVEVDHPRGLMLKRVIVSNRYNKAELDSLNILQKNAMAEEIL